MLTVEVMGLSYSLIQELIGQLFSQQCALSSVFNVT